MNKIFRERENLNNQRKQKVEGLILYHNLVDWWLTNFSQDERRYIDNRFQPMNQSAHTLTSGKYKKRQGEIIDTASFLNSLATWFRSKSDSTILKRIQEKIHQVGRERPIEASGYVRGRHYTTFVQDVKSLKKQAKFEELEKLLLELVDATEAENKVEKMGVAPWYYEELAKLFRKQKDYKKEVNILKRFSKQRHARGVMPKKLLVRLEKASVLAGKEN